MGSKGTRKPQKPQTVWYRQIVHRGRKTYLHIERAEKALGHPLPKGAIVHHVDGSYGDTSPLVICQDQAYHKLLHYREKVIRLGGNADVDLVCSKCRLAKPRDEFYKSRGHRQGHSYYCKSCTRAANRKAA